MQQQQQHTSVALARLEHLHAGHAAAARRVPQDRPRPATRAASHPALHLDTPLSQVEGRGSINGPALAAPPTSLPGQTLAPAPHATTTASPTTAGRLHHLAGGATHVIIGGQAAHRDTTPPTAEPGAAAAHGGAALTTTPWRRGTDLQQTPLLLRGRPLTSSPTPAATRAWQRATAPPPPPSPAIKEEAPQVEDGAGWRDPGGGVHEQLLHVRTAGGKGLLRHRSQQAFTPPAGGDAYSSPHTHTHHAAPPAITPITAALLQHPGQWPPHRDDLATPPPPPRGAPPPALAPHPGGVGEAAARALDAWASTATGSGAATASALGFFDRLLAGQFPLSPLRPLLSPRTALAAPQLGDGAPRGAGAWWGGGAAAATPQRDGEVPAAGGGYEGAASAVLGGLFGQQPQQHKAPGVGGGVLVAAAAGAGELFPAPFDDQEMASFLNLGPAALMGGLQGLPAGLGGRYGAAAGSGGGAGGGGEEGGVLWRGSSNVGAAVAELDQLMSLVGAGAALPPLVSLDAATAAAAMERSGSMQVAGGAEHALHPSRR